MCCGKLPGKSPRHPGRARALPLCGPWPRPHLAAAKLVELRSSVNLVAMPYQPLDRPVASLTNPGLRDVRYAHIAPPRAILGAPRCGCRGESQRAGDTNPGCLGVASSGGWPLRPALAPLAWLAQPVARPACGIHQWINRKARSASGTTCVWHSPMDQSQGSLSQTARPACGIHQWINRKARSARWHDLRVAFTNGSIARLAQPDGTKKLPCGDYRPHVSASRCDHFLMLPTKNPIRCQIPPQQGAAVGVVLSFGADLIPILNLDATLAAIVLRRQLACLRTRVPNSDFHTPGANTRSQSQECGNFSWNP
jgi:hypothetical protein